MTPNTRPPRPVVPAYSAEERARIADAYEASEDVYTREVHYHPDGRVETIEIDPRDALRISRDRTDAPTSPISHLRWGHISISSAKAQHDELEAAVRALGLLPIGDWRRVQSVACKRDEYVVEFTVGTTSEIARDIVREFARSVFRDSGGHNGVVAEIGGDYVWTVPASWQCDEDPEEAAS